jgi:hypothetical protein
LNLSRSWDRGTPYKSLSKLPTFLPNFVSRQRGLLNWRKNRKLQIQNHSCQISDLGAEVAKNHATHATSLTHSSDFTLAQNHMCDTDHQITRCVVNSIDSTCSVATNHRQL